MSKIKEIIRDLGLDAQLDKDLGDLYDPIAEFEGEARSQIVKEAARRRKAEKPPSQPGPIGSSTMEKIDSQVDSALSRESWEEDE